jgi:hypothetical protein
MNNIYLSIGLNTEIQTLMLLGLNSNWRLLDNNSKELVKIANCEKYRIFNLNTNLRFHQFHKEIRIWLKENNVSELDIENICLQLASFFENRGEYNE